jgi:hypothetical protein
MPSREYLVDGDQGFIGLNSRDNPVNLGKNFVSKSQNFRMDRGVATLRKGAERLTPSAFVSTGRVIYASCTYTDTTGVEYIILICGDGLYKFNQETESFAAAFVAFPAGEVITASDDVDAYQAQGNGYVYICRGFSKTTLRWDGATTIVVPNTGVHHNYPNSRHAIYYGNRHLVQTDGNTFQVSHYLKDDTWSSLDMFSINDGGNDRLIAITPWTLNEFVVFMRNSIFYANVGVGAYQIGDPAQESDSYVKSLATDIGCVARKSVVQAGGGIFFLSDNGVYVANPAGAGSAGTNASTPEGMRLLTLSEPLSSPISDVIERINYNYVSGAVAAYFENRYYLAVPLDSSTVNNAVLVYNFINKAWESVDTYTAGFDIKAFHVVKKGNRRRLFAIDQQQGIFLMENLDWDEYVNSTGTPILDDPTFKLDSIGAKLQAGVFTPYSINGILTTRAYSFDTNREKRFSSVQADMSMTVGADVYIDLVVVNPDSTTRLNSFFAQEDEDYLLRLPARKSGYYAQVKYTVNAYRPSIRSTTIQAVVPGQTTISKR